MNIIKQINIDYSAVNLDKNVCNMEDLQRIERALRLSIKGARRFGQVWLVYVNCYNVWVDTEKKTASCECIDFNKHSLRKPCKHIYAAIFYAMARQEFMSAHHYTLERLGVDAWAQHCENKAVEASA